MIHNQMSHNQAKKWVLNLVYRAAIDFKKLKKKIESTGPRYFLNVKKLFQGTKNYTNRTCQINISFQLLFFFHLIDQLVN